MTIFFLGPLFISGKVDEDALGRQVARPPRLLARLPDYMQDYESAAKESEGGARTEEGQQSAGQQQRTRIPNNLCIPSNPFESMPSMLAVDAFFIFLEVALAEALAANAAQDWWRNWPAGRTIMLRMASK